MGKKLYFGDFADRRLRVDPDVIIELQMDYVVGENGKAVVIWDEVVKGLRVRIGRRVASWQYYHEQMEHGHRFIKCDTLGHFECGTFAGFIRQGYEPQISRSPAHMSTADARRAAEILRGKVLEGVAPVGKRRGLTVADAMINGWIKPGSAERQLGYVEYLESKAKNSGKPPRWAEKVRSLYKVLFVPSINGRVPMADRTLQELSDDPSIAEDWHRDCKKESGPTSANRASQVLRAMYSRTARRGGKKLGLSKVDLPTASVEMHRENKVQKGLDPVVQEMAANPKPGEARISHDLLVNRRATRRTRPRAMGLPIGGRQSLHAAPNQDRKRHHCPGDATDCGRDCAGAHCTHQYKRRWQADCAKRYGPNVSWVLQ